MSPRLSLLCHLVALLVVPSFSYSEEAPHVYKGRLTTEEERGVKHAFLVEAAKNDAVETELQFQQKIAELIVASNSEPNAHMAASYDLPIHCDSPGNYGGDDQHGASTSDRCWNVALLFGNEYDSNVGAFPEFDGLGAINDKDDNRFILASFVDLRLFDQPTWNLGLIGSVFSSFHYDQDDFDLQDYMGGAYLNKILSEQMFAGLRYEFHETRLGGEHLASDNRLTPNLSMLHDDWGHTTFYYEFSTATLNAPALIPSQIQSGAVHSVGATHAIYTFGEDGRVYLGYRFEDANTDGDDFDRQSHMATARLERPLCEGLIVDAEVRHFWDEYDNPNSLDFWERPRDDTRLELRTGLQKNFRQRWSARVDYTFTDTNSNVRNLFGVNFYEYSRHVLSTQMIYEF